MKIFPSHAFLVGIEFSETKKNIFEDNMQWTWTRCSFPLKLELRNHYLFSTKVTPQNFCLLRGQGHNRNVHVYAVHILWTLISTRLFSYISTKYISIFYCTYYRSWPLSLVYNKLWCIGKYNILLFRT